MSTLSSRRASSQVHVNLPASLEPAQSGQTTYRRAGPTLPRRSPRRRLRPAHTDLATQHFVQAEESWIGLRHSNTRNTWTFKESNWSHRDSGKL